MAVLYELSSQFYNLPVLFYVVAGLVVVWYFRTRERLPDNLPPFPIKPYPILGHIPAIKPDTILDTFQKWRKKVGDSFSLRLGSQLVVVFNDYESIKEAFVKKGQYFADRPIHNVLAQNLLKTKGELEGVIFNNGPNWKEQRTVSMQILREFGMGKNLLAEKITEEIQVYLDTLSALKGRPKDVRMLTTAAVSNVICAILKGHRFELDDPSFVRLLELLNEVVLILSQVGAVNVFPFLRHLPGDLFKAKRLLQNQKEAFDYFSLHFVQNAKENNDMNNFIGSYLHEIDKKQTLGLNTSLDEDNLIRVISNLFAAGSETTSTTILWALIFAMHHSDSQEKCYQEILELVGTERLPNMLDKSKLNYVNAYIMETQRLGSVVPLSISRICANTVDVGGYTIPAGATVIPNLDSVLKDEKIWGDPQVFRPERFLDENNQVFVPDQFIPFSTGRRYCMAESLARMELYLYISCVFQRFKILPEYPDNLPPLDAIFGLTRVPKPFTVRFVERHGGQAM